MTPAVSPSATTIYGTLGRCRCLFSNQNRSTQSKEIQSGRLPLKLDEANDNIKLDRDWHWGTDLRDGRSYADIDWVGRWCW